MFIFSKNEEKSENFDLKTKAKRILNNFRNLFNTKPLVVIDGYILKPLRDDSAIIFYTDILIKRCLNLGPNEKLPCNVCIGNEEKIKKINKKNKKYFDKDKKNEKTKEI